LIKCDDSFIHLVLEGVENKKIEVFFEAELRGKWKELSPLG
jgi:hypothetical protein